MRQLTTSSTALTTTRHTRNSGLRGRTRHSVTVFNPPAPTDPAADLVAAMYGWGRVAVPVADPGPCPVAWCVDCWVGKPETLDDGIAFHHSARVTAEADTYNGVTDRRSAADRTFHISVERYDAADMSEPATAYLEVGTEVGVTVPAGKAREIAGALSKALDAALGLLARGGTAGTTAAVSVVRSGGDHLQIGAVLGGKPGANQTVSIFINSVTVLPAGNVREIARGALVNYPPATWDFTPHAARLLADGFTAAAALVDADRAAVAVSA